MTDFDVGVNNLHGTTPPDFVVNLPNLRWFSFDSNQLTGPIPYSLSNAFRIEYLSFGGNRFSGAVPMNLEMLQALIWFNIEDNLLGGE